ncbi:MAG: hypothetical protein LAO79_28175, partial [Acidobacteriia bacterium]|nr:hypothetical protein [Terriglobia bacterium]
LFFQFADQNQDDDSRRDRALAEIRRLVAAVGVIKRPYLVIVHRFWQRGTECLPGEQVAFVCLVWNGEIFPLRLPLSLLLVADFLGQHRWCAHSAAQIEAGIRNDEFYARHAANARLSRKQTRKIVQGAVKEYIRRLREALRLVLAEARLDRDPAAILRSESLVGREVGYRITLKVYVVHVP